MSPPTEDRCMCGHVEDEHEDSWLAPCEADECPCLAYEEDGGDDE